MNTSFQTIHHLFIKTNSGEEMEEFCEWFMCPSCHNNDIMKATSYCPHCGKRIVWMGENGEEDDIAKSVLDNTPIPLNNLPIPVAEDGLPGCRLER
jgi:predicted RNA-binding Zn-ribbon protein involved in translation (DUF1610 family)